MTTESKLVDELHAAIVTLMNGHSLDYWPRSQFHGGGFASCFRAWLQARHQTLYQRAVDYLAVNDNCCCDPIASAVERYIRFPTEVNLIKPHDVHYNAIVLELLYYIERRRVALPITDEQETTVTDDVKEYLRSGTTTEDLADMTELLSLAIKHCFK